LKEWDGRPARLFFFIRYGRDARATLRPIPKVSPIYDSLEKEILSSDFLNPHSSIPNHEERSGPNVEAAAPNALSLPTGLVMIASCFGRLFSLA
jgi:hypothetical protein